MRLVAAAFFAMLFILPYSSAQVVIPTNAAKNIESWIGVPAEYLGSPRDIIVFVVIPFVVAALIMHGIWKEIGILNNDTANFWIPVLAVFASFQFGFFKFVKALYGSTQSLVFAGAAVVAYVMTAKIRQRVGSLGYTGMFSGVVGYALDAVGLGIFFGGTAGALSGGRLGPVVYVAASVGAGLGIFLVWWNKRGKRNSGGLKALENQDEDIERRIADLEKKRDELFDKANRAPDEAARLPFYRDMATYQQDIEILKAKRGVVEERLEKAATG